MLQQDLGWQPGSFTSWPTTTTRQRNILSPGSTGQVLCAVKIFNSTCSKHLIHLSIIALNSLNYPVNMRQRISYLLAIHSVFSHNVLVIHGKKIRETWSREKSVQSIAVGMTTDVERALGQWHKSLAKFFTLKWSCHVSMIFGWYAYGCDIYQTLWFDDTRS